MIKDGSVRKVQVRQPQPKMPLASLLGLSKRAYFHSK